jgi:hypothetical protein
MLAPLSLNSPYASETRRNLSINRRFRRCWGPSCMPHYTFAFGSVLEPAQVIEVLADDNAARLHADIVAKEFNRNRDRPVAVLVLDERGRLVHRAAPAHHLKER